MTALLSRTEENYLKGIYALQDKKPLQPVTTSEVADLLQTQAASVTDMLQKLSNKKLIHYRKYQGVLLTAAGRRKAVAIVRKHRLWEYFLVQKLHFPWDQVHEVAEQMEHIHSDLLVEKLDEFLGHPRFDPHGDPIPDTRGKINTGNFRPLSSLLVREKGKVAAVVEQQPAFLQYLDQLSIRVGTTIRVLEQVPYDRSMRIRIRQGSPVSISFEIAKNILISQ